MKTDTFEHWKKTENGKTTRVYRLWCNMKMRCEEGDYSYDVRWENFQTFAWDISFLYGWRINGSVMVCDLFDTYNRRFGYDTVAFLPKNLYGLVNGMKTPTSGIRITKSLKYQVYVRKYGKVLYLGTYENYNSAVLTYRNELNGYITDVAYRCFRHEEIDERTLKAIISNKECL